MARKPDTPAAEAWRVLAAWLSVTQNLPEGWSLLELCRMAPNTGPEAWYASAGNYGHQGWDGQEVIESTGRTAIQCLANLGEHLARRKGRRGRPPKDPALPPKPPPMRTGEVQLYRSPDIHAPALPGFRTE